MRWVKTLWPDSDAHTQHSLHSSWPATSGPATTSYQALKHSRTPQDSAHPAKLHWYLHDSPSICITVSVSFIALHAINSETDCSGSREASPRRFFFSDMKMQYSQNQRTETWSSEFISSKDSDPISERAKYRAIITQWFCSPVWDYGLVSFWDRNVFSLRWLHVDRKLKRSFQKKITNPKRKVWQEDVKDALCNNALIKDASKNWGPVEPARLSATKPAAFTVEKQLSAVRLMSGWLKVLSETKLHSGQIKITFWRRTMGPLIWGQPN